MTLFDYAAPTQRNSSARRSRASSAQAWKFAAVAALALLVLPVGACSKNSSTAETATPAGSTDDPAVASVNGVQIRQSDLALAEDDLGESIHQMDPATKREQLIAYMTDVVLLSKEAEKRNLQSDPDLKRREAFMHNKMMMGLLLQNHVKGQTSDAELRKVYDDAMKSMASEEEVRARHILVETEDEAKAILEQVKGGADFADLAKQKSKDPSAQEGGGDLGYFTKGQMVPEFSEVAFKMYPGQVSNPVKSQFGWHIIKVEDKRTRQPPPFELVKDQIYQYVARRAQAEFVAQLRETAKIERLDKGAGASGMPAGIPPEILQRLQQQQQQEREQGQAQPPAGDAPAGAQPAEPKPQ
jgi:peptidyl-prolyl cis-trans isomerase C